MDRTHLLEIALRNEGEVTRREHDLAARVIDELIDAHLLLSTREQAVVIRDAGANQDLPAPRLQLRWECDEADSYERICHYELVLPLQKYDIRRDLAPSGFAAIPLGRTKVSGGFGVFMDGKVEEPYRDGAHARWDATVFGLPVYTVWKEHASRVDLDQDKRGLETAPVAGDADGWQPIETLQDRESLPAVWIAHAPSDSILVAYFDRRTRSWRIKWSDAQVEWEPTHWMPIPQTPSNSFHR